MFTTESSLSILNNLPPLALVAINILLGDFNLHYPSWGGDSMSYTVDIDARDLFEATEAAGIGLILRQGAVTYSDYS